MSLFLVSFQTEIASTTRPIAAISRGDHPAARQSLTHSIIITTFRDRHRFNLTWKSNGAYSGARKRQHSSSHFYCVLSEEKFSQIKKNGKGFLESKATLKSVTVGSSHPHGHEKAKFRLLSTKTPYMPVPNAAPWGSIPEKYWREIMQHTLQTPKKVWNRYASVALIYELHVDFFKCSSLVQMEFGLGKQEAICAPSSFSIGVGEKNVLIKNSWFLTQFQRAWTWRYVYSCNKHKNIPRTRKSLSFVIPEQNVTIRQALPWA